MVTIVPPPLTTIKTKDGVQFGGFTAGLARILTVLCSLAVKWQILITSGSDGKHSVKPLSRHYTFEAVDLMSHHLLPGPKAAFKAELEAALGPQFTVLLEDEGIPNEHFHVQVRLGHTYQPESA